MHKANQATLKEAAEILGVSFSAVQFAAHRGTIPSYKEPKQNKTRRRIMVDLTDVEAWIETRRATGKQRAYELFNKGHSIDSIVERTDIARSTILKELNKHGIHFDRRGEVISS